MRNKEVIGMKIAGVLLIIATAFYAAACNNFYNTDRLKPSALTYATTSAIYTRGLVIQDNKPTVNGMVASWSVSPALPAGLFLHSRTGIISGMPAADQEAAEYIITAENDFGSDTTVISIAVNELPPAALTYAATSAVYTQDLAIANNIPSYTGTVSSWSVDPALPAGLSMDPSSGIISGTPTVLQPVTAYAITAANAYGSTSVTMTITVNLEAPAGLSYATSTAIYTRYETILNNAPMVTGTVESWSISPALPAGLSFNTSTGVISGTPTASQDATNYTITATNTGGSATAVISIAINLEAPSSLSYATGAAVYTVNAAITNNTPVYAGTVGSWSVYPPLPAGLTLNTTTGVISGMPTATQDTAYYNIYASNSGGTTTANISITVNYDAPTGLSYATADAAYTEFSVIPVNTPAVTGTVTSWSVSPALPAGLILNTTTGVISGTPAESSSRTYYDVTATNSGGSTTARIFITVNICAPSNLSYGTNPAGYVRNAAITENVPSVTGTVSSWSVTAGSLPAGLSLNTTTGVITGAPTAAQTPTGCTITATNAMGSTSVILNIAVILYDGACAYPLNITGTLSTLAGTGAEGSQDGPGAEASFDNPCGITSDGLNLYVADQYSNEIRKIEIATGMVSTLAGNTSWGNSDGVGRYATFTWPYTLTTDGSYVYVGEQYYGNIRKIEISTRMVSTIVNGLSYSPTGMTTDGTYLYMTVSESDDGYCVKKMTISSGAVTTLAGSATQGSQDGTGASAAFHEPKGIAICDNYLYVGDHGRYVGWNDPNNIDDKIRRIDKSTGAVTTIVSTPPNTWSPGDITTDGSYLYMTCTVPDTIVKIDITTHAFSTIASGLDYPLGITTDGRSLFICDTWHHVIRKLE